VLANLRAEPCGAGTVADLCLPEPFLRRVADRVLRASYVERFRVIIADGQPPEPVPPLPEGSPPPVVQHVHAAAPNSFVEGPPERPGFRAHGAQLATSVDTGLVPREFGSRATDCWRRRAR